MEKLDRITQRPEIMGGKACIRGIRVTVGMIVGQIGAGRSVDELLAEYPYLEREDILQALRYAAWRAEDVMSCWPTREASRRYETITALGRSSECSSLSGGSNRRSIAAGRGQKPARPLDQLPVRSNS